MQQLAQHSNVYCKISGMVTEADWKNWKKEDFWPYLEHITKSFTPNRMMFGSDWPVAPIDPVYGIYSAVTRITGDGKNPNGWYPDEKLSIEDALKAYTATNAYASFLEGKIGILKEGFYADLVIVNAGLPWNVKKENILAKCGWSPFEGYNFKSRISHTFVNGELVYQNFKVKDKKVGKRLLFEREL